MSSLTGIERTDLRAVLNLAVREAATDDIAHRLMLKLLKETKNFFRDTKSDEDDVLRDAEMCFPFQMPADREVLPASMQSV